MGCKGSKQPIKVVESKSKPKGKVVLLGNTGGAEDATAAKPADAEPAAAYLAVTNGDVEVGDAATIRATAEEVSVLKRTTTDLFVRTPDGKELWYAVEDVCKAASTGFKVGDDAIICSTSERVIIVQKTTTDILVNTADGKEQWCDVEDAGEVPSAAVATSADADNGGKALVAADAEQPTAALAEAAAAEAPAAVAMPAEQAANKMPAEPSADVACGPLLLIELAELLGRCGENSTTTRNEIVVKAASD